MNNDIFKTPNSSFLRKKLFGALLSSGLILFSGNAFAGQNEALTSIARAEAKIEMATRQAGLAGSKGDQSYNMSNERIVAARSALKDGRYESAEYLAEEASLLAELTSEKAKLSALQNSSDALIKVNQAATKQ